MPIDAQNRRPLLGIALPTFERAYLLEQALDSICCEIGTVRGEVSVTVCDNASSDLTSAVIEAARKNHPEIVSLRNSVNIGGVANILKCVEAVQSEWIWIFPDDCLLEPGALKRLLINLKQAGPPIVYARCSRWSDDELDSINEIQVSRLFGDHGEIWHHLSWLPCVILHRDSIVQHIPQAYRLAGHSYPHLVLALMAARGLNSAARIAIATRAFDVQAAIEEKKRYSWVHGAIWQFAKTLSFCLPAPSARRVLRHCAEKERLGRQVLACMYTEFAVIPARTPWSLVSRYSVSMVPALLVFLWLRYLPRALNRLFLALACWITRGGSPGHLRQAMHRLAARLAQPEAKLEADF